jgi:hypothetical protein
MPCEDWHHLLRQYRSAVKDYYEAVESLDTVRDVQFDETWHRAERARSQAGSFRAALLHHEHEHECLTVDGPAKNEDLPVQETDTLVLGDQGQSGG